MSLLDEITERYGDADRPFLQWHGGSLNLAAVRQVDSASPVAIMAGDVVALVGDFNAQSIATLFRLLDGQAIVAPLTGATAMDHPYYYESALVDVVIDGVGCRRIRQEQARHPWLDLLRERGSPGLILFSSGTTGRPKAILHDFNSFLVRYRTPRPAWRTLQFLLFDHIGGINTLFHTLFNRGELVIPQARDPDGVVRDLGDYGVALLPTTPTFLRMMLLHGVMDRPPPPTLRVVTYGTERMDQSTLDRCCAAWPTVDFRQTYGMSELGILRVRSVARDSLWMQVGGEGVSWKVTEGVLWILAEQRMVGYLNAPSPFQDGWYDTGDLVTVAGDRLQVVGRVKEVINVGGIKVLPGEIERVALRYPGILRAKAKGVANPITGQHVEITCEPEEDVVPDRAELRRHFQQHLPEPLRPLRIVIGAVLVSHRFKQA